MERIRLKPDRERSVQRRHPWIFANAIARLEGTPAPGATVEVLSYSGAMLGRGAYSPKSQIAVRMWSFDPQTAIGPEYLHQLLAHSLATREKLCAGNERPASRLVNAEADGLPGLVVDRYAEYLVCQFTAAGVEFWKRDIVASLARLVPSLKGIYERSDVSVRQKEGLELTTGVLWGEPPPELVEVREASYRFLVDIKSGHKTGWYLDQRDSRARVGEYAADREVLNCFCYTGGFTVAALANGARHVTNIDSSAPALALTQRNVALNNLDPASSTNLEGNAFELLRSFRDSRRQFDCIILDPPKFIESEHQLKQGARGYKDINLLAIKLLRPDGILITFSCSGHMNAELFQTVVAQAATDAKRSVQLIRPLAQAEDHPVALNFPEGAYLKGMVCRVA
jgi:23S rRNA (cytosine1962-C5)-methyltransferase